MLKILVFIGLTCLTFSCGNSEPDTIILVPVEPKLPPLDCNEIANRAAADVAARGLGTSAAGASVVNETRANCQRENARRGY